MKPLIFILSLFFSIPCFSIHIDSVKVGGYRFQFYSPRKWKLVSKDTGICLSDNVNVRLRMSDPVPGTFGDITISISEITYTERERRRSADTSDTEANSEHDWVKKKTLNGYRLTNAHLLTERIFSQAYWDSIQGDTPYTNKQKRQLAKWKDFRIHFFSHLYHFPINDSLEIFIQFQGDVYNDGQIGYLVDYIAKDFFTRNKKDIDALLISADPYRLEPKINLYDSIFFLNTVVRYPALPGWTIDTTRTESNIWTKVMHLRYQSNESCDYATITMQYRVTKLEGQSSSREEFEKMSLSDLYKLYEPYRNLSNDQREKYRDSTFNAAEQHYYFGRNSETEKSENCTTKLDYSETVYIVVYTQTKERIRIAVTLNTVTSDYIKERDCRHDLYRLVNLMSEATDFEQFYKNSK